MDNLLFSLLCLKSCFLVILGGCIWEQESDKNIVGQYFEIFEGNVAACLDRCDLNPACKSVDYTIENGINQCQLNSVTRTEAAIYQDSPGVYHYYCVFDGSTEQPFPVTSTEETTRDSGQSSDEFYDWLKEEPEYFTIICLAIFVILLFLTIVIVLCCYVKKPAIIHEGEDIIGLSTIYEEPDSILGEKSANNNENPDKIDYVEYRPQTTQPFVQDNPVFQNGVNYSEIVHPNTTNINLADNQTLSGDANDKINDSDIPDTYAKPDTPVTGYEYVQHSSNDDETARSDLSVADTENPYEQPIPSPPPLPEKNWNMELP